MFKEIKTGQVCRAKADTTWRGESSASNAGQYLVFDSWYLILGIWYVVLVTCSYLGKSTVYFDHSS